MNKVIFFSLIIFLTTMAQEANIKNRLYETYGNYKEDSIKQKRFKHSEILPLIEKLKQNKNFSVREAGRSVEDREIFQITLGKGKTKILLWSQMHGDESTASMALFDIFNFFSASKDGFDNFRKEILSKATLYFIPMLNPDGAEKFQRRNALDVDLNRDAARLQMPEAILLKKIRDSLNADFGFNLHDQSTRYSAGNSFKSAAISFLAPAFNFNKDINQIRERSIKLIAELNEYLSIYIPGHIAKYSDDFEPRAFGDNVQKWGTSTILIESGGWKNDYEKQFLRKLNYIALLSSFSSIAKKNYEKYTVEQYEQIPNNDQRIFDLILRNLTANFAQKDFKVDIGINLYEKTSGSNTLYFRGIIDDIGDLSVFYGYDEYDCSGMEVFPGKIFPQSFNSIEEIKELDFTELLSKGYTSVLLNNDNETKPIDLLYTDCPIQILTTRDEAKSEINLGDIANLIISDKGKVRFAIINGFMFDLLTNTNRIYNGLVNSD